VRRREVIALVTAAVACPSVAHAQAHANILRIGMMQGGRPTVSAALVDVFKERLRELGYVEGLDYALEIRWADITLRSHDPEKPPVRQAQLTAKRCCSDSRGWSRSNLGPRTCSRAHTPGSPGRRLM
jgi:hypothetical protein